MRQVDKTVAFKHRISGEFDDNQRMTAGEAVMFAKYFQKPTASPLYH